MYFAVDCNGDKISIRNAIRGNEYYCPACGGRLIMKCGDVVEHHFAHDRDSLCDSWYSDNKGAWHRAIQSLFPEQSQEVVVRSDGDPWDYHIADIYLTRKNKSNVIIEFQQSPISKSEFMERNDFYISNARNIINGKPVCNTLCWIFLFADKTTIQEHYRTPDRKEKSYRNGRRQYIWNHRARQFDDYDFQNTKNPIILFDIGDNYYVRVDYAFEGCKFFGGKTIQKSDFIRWAIHTGKTKVNNQ